MLDQRNIGCYLNTARKVSNRLLPVQVWKDDRSTTIDNCIIECKSKNYTYAGLQVSIVNLYLWIFIIILHGM